MLLPGPDHPISISEEPRTVRVMFNGKVVAETSRALLLAEAAYPPVHYIPREDARIEHFTPTRHETGCPYKGTASYFTLEVEGKRSENAVWSYEKPYPAVAKIAGMLAFYPQRIDAIEIS
ncbi:MAG TPA: DUF427 domain-containing protein [Xanthobacteraceae bacterium]|nr:DUF427 domain-containing protein [Xanthobacteraceae bacterium]